MNNKEIFFALEILLKSIEDMLVELNKEAEQALISKDYKKLKLLVEGITELDSLKEKAKGTQKLLKELFLIQNTEHNEKLFVQEEKQNGTQEFVESVNPKKLSEEIVRPKNKKGKKTPHAEFRIPVLEALAELGGSAESIEVIKRVGEKMKDKLKDDDFEPLPSNGEIRWENAVRWCRLQLIFDGLLSPHSPRGIWEITEEGKKYLEAFKNH
ncbi:MAG: winged helix-turn-helix domain-containing protein [Candidatus Aenigmatarchaeota archaeon]